MHTYHILYFDNEKDIYAKGVNITAINPRNALDKFELNYTNKIFFSLTLKH